jgi:hypothetical protein
MMILLVVEDEDTGFAKAAQCGTVQSRWIHSPTKATAEVAGAGINGQHSLTAEMCLGNGTIESSK